MSYSNNKKVMINEAVHVSSYEYNSFINILMLFIFYSHSLTGLILYKWTYNW